MSGLNKILILLILVSIIQVNESRFLWDFGSYCLNYCAKAEFELAAISICSCHMIVSNHRQMDSDKTSPNKNNRYLKFKHIFN
jgi:hypothetical protein